MKEVYWGCFERGPDGLALARSPERVGPPDSVELPSTWAEAAGVGRGFTAYPALRALAGVTVPGGYDQLLPRAAEVARLAVPELTAGRLLAPEAAVPVYLRDDVARPPP
jgi:tRNA threonylcarbamoyladenosine biosynthesis protein TsaB